MQSNNSDGGGLNFVFESGSSGCENKKYVRSHAAKVGWSQRSRNKAVPKKEDGAKEDAPPKKRRKTHTQPASGEPSQTRPSTPSHGSFIASVIEHTPSEHVQGSSSLADHRPMQQHAYLREPQFAAYPAARLPSPGVASPYHASVQSPPRSSPHQYQYGHHQRPAQVHDVLDQSPSHPISTATFARTPICLVSQTTPSWHELADPSRHVTAVQQVSVPQFRPAAQSLSMRSRDVNPGSGNVQSATRISSLPSPLPSPLPNSQAFPSTQASLMKANWRQYDDFQSISTGALSPLIQEEPTEHSDWTSEARDVELLNKPTTSTPPTRSSTLGFFELVLNEDYPLWRPVDSGSNSFNIFPVKWQPIYGRLLENYRSNMLVQLDEILTGWSVNEKIEFNQMPLRLAGSEPSLFYSLLATASVMLPPGLIAPAIPKWLQNRTVTCLNEAFSDPKRAYSDATILTVNMVALFESITGHGQAAAAVHQPMLRKMVGKRGGLKELAGDDDLDTLNLARLLAWTDRVIRCQTGNALMFADYEEDPSVSKTNWDDIWKRMERRVEQNVPAPVEEILEDE